MCEISGWTKAQPYVESPVLARSEATWKSAVLCLIVPVSWPCTGGDRRSPEVVGCQGREAVLGLPAPGSAGGLLRKPGTIA